MGSITPKFQSKSRRGGAYITVLTVTMVLLMIGAVVLSITAVSRRVSASYSYFVGLFDMAVAGNEQAFFLLRPHVATQRETVNEQAWERFLAEATVIGLVYDNGGFNLDDATRNEFRRVYNEVAVQSLSSKLVNISDFTNHHFDFRLEWDVETVIDTGEAIISDSYSAVTTLMPRIGYFRVFTRVHRYIAGNPGVPVYVDAVINWAPAGRREIILDGYTIDILNAAGAGLPIILIPGAELILFLDEFALTMLESIRVSGPRPTPTPG